MKNERNPALREANLGKPGSNMNLHVCMFSSWQVRCGIADYASHLIDALREIGGVQVSVVPFDRQTHPRTDYTRWGEMMNAGDVAHIQHEYAFFQYLLPWRNHFPAFVSRIRKPIVITKHVSFDGPLRTTERGWRRLVRQIKWALYNRWLGPYATYLNKDTFDVADQIIVLSARLKEQLVERDVRADKINVVPPGVPDVPSATGGEQLRAAWGWTDKHIICQFGFITPSKGHTVALEALAQLPDTHVLLIAGGLRREADRPALQAIEHQMARLQLEDRVRITGYLDRADVSAHIGASDILIYPYTHADSSYSLMTGLAYQTAPIIASDVYAHRELAQDCRGVALFRNGDPADLAHQIRLILKDTDLRTSMQTAISQFVQDHSWRAVADRTLEVYRKALSTKPR